MNEDVPIRIIVVDDHAVVRAGIRALLERLPGVTVIGEAPDGREGLNLIQQEHPDVVFVDISMPGLNGLGLIRQASLLAPDVRVIVLSMYPSEDFVAEALREGASGYLLKQNANLAELEAAITCVCAGGQYLTPAISTQIRSGYFRSKQPEPLRLLTPRQREILQMIGEGLGTKDIASRLSISVKTVDTHRSELMERLAIREVAGLVRYAIQTGIVRLD